MQIQHRDMFSTKPYKIRRLLSTVNPAEVKKKKNTSRMFDAVNITGISYVCHGRL